MTNSAPSQRFVVIGAPTLLDLITGMNNNPPVYMRLIYFGPNLGDYDNTEIYSDMHRDTKYIAVFDAAPMFVYPVEDIELVDQNDTSNEVLDYKDTVMSA